VLIAVALLGGVIGAGGVLWMTAAREPKKASPTPGSDVQERVALLSSQQARYAARLAALEATTQGQRDTASAALPSPPAPDTTESEAARARETPAEQRLEQEELLAAHAAEPIDARWARATTAELERALEVLQQPGDMRVAEVTCRSQTCLARLSWPTQQAAFEVQSRVITGLATDLPCVRRLYLGAEGQRADAFEGALLLDCSPEL